MLRVGIDVGGTFTDLYAWDEEASGSRKVRMSKVLSTPNDLVSGFMNALSEAEIPPSEISTIIHGTTVGTNALIERKYPEPALIATEGFRDTIEIGRQSRSHLYDPYAVKPSPLVSRDKRFTVSEKLGADGKTVKPLDREGAKQVAEQIAQRGIKNIAITFINSYVDGRHEQEMRDIILEVIPDAKIALSSETRPKMRELGRFVTTTIRAALFPVIGDYITRLEKALKDSGCTAPLFIVKSNGGMMRASTAKERPEEMIESGPAGGVAAGSFMYNMLGLENMIITDVGGTSFEASLVEKGQGLITDEYELEWEMPIITPMLDIRSIGAGGGSIAWIDDGGSLRVGPKSAGADPGPVCYGKGGTQPTVTDANLVLGRLNSTLSGKFELDKEAAIQAIKTVAEPLGLSVIDCAEGIVEIACENMADAIRMVSTDRGRDPRDQTYVSFGGAGGLHAFGVAQSAGINRILIPSFVGVDCATGATTMDVRHDVESAFYQPVNGINTNKLTEAFTKLEEECAELLENDGISSEDMTFERVALMRYIGQSYEVATPVPDGPINEDTLPEITEAFNREHKREYGVSNESFPTAVVTLRVTGHGKTEKPKDNDFQTAMGPNSQEGISSVKERRDVYFRGEKHTVEVHDVSRFREEQEITGPAIIEHPNSEIVVPPDAFANIDQYGFINITINKTINEPNKEVLS
ncbi:hydantoinase/oxoprolinase family protein [Alteribacillus iranensis]|uniref:N-methylhydantoinase A n=1 Tax=Alteribacillus iranensis TaxID=930128 RepID=A0A1I2DJI7_9BACI|nr:hydantoinase/oxoprolinase family protein [Alteribacillus iranensis]SFE80608.1 N-methylhydantoinase A [Alteribacillus iranensis]